jgi:SOS-response transcriptional repressor LexA
MGEITLSENLKRLMRLHGNLTVSQLSRLTQIPQPTLHHILSGATKSPRKPLLEILANFFSISAKQLLGEISIPTIIPEIIKKNLQIKSVPIISWEMLEAWPLPNVQGLHLKEILLDREIGANSFALRVQDSLAEPIFPENALLIFDFDKRPMDRDFVITIAQNGAILFNRFFTDNNEHYIKQTLENGDVKLIKLDKTTDRILGTLIEVRIQY